MILPDHSAWHSAMQECQGYTTGGYKQVLEVGTSRPPCFVCACLRWGRACTDHDRMLSPLAE